MFDNNVFLEGSCKNIEENGQITGYELQTNITYYRGIPLSMVNDIRVTVDGEEVPRADIRFSVKLTVIVRTAYIPVPLEGNRTRTVII